VTIFKKAVKFKKEIYVIIKEGALNSENGVSF
jgi:hypothetical protein